MRDIALLQFLQTGWPLFDFSLFRDSITLPQQLQHVLAR